MQRPIFYLLVFCILCTVTLISYRQWATPTAPPATAAPATVTSPSTATATTAPSPVLTTDHIDLRPFTLTLAAPWPVLRPTDAAWQTQLQQLAANQPRLAHYLAALANTPAFDALPAETTAQIVQAMRLQLTRGGGEAHIKLEPHHFGDLKVSIKVEQGQVTARLEAEVPVVREWLQSNQALLRTSLAEQNLTLDRLEVAEPREPRDSEERQQHKEERPKPQSSRRRRSETRDVFEVVA